MIKLQVPAVPEAVPEARRALAALEPDIWGEHLENVRLLVSELMTNSVRHSGVAQDDLIELRVFTEQGSVRVEVRDLGQGFEPPDTTPSLYQESGWGLYLVRQIADRWGVLRDGATCVWFEIDPLESRSSQGNPAS
ncbi:MAG: ATP-binding protein [Actinomycetota bacterium]